MAKSIRSKHRRRMRAVKREQFGKKELERLKGVVERAKASDVEMKELFILKSADELKKGKKDGEAMETSKASKNYNTKTLRNEHGNYPVWVSQRNLRKIKRSEKKKEKAKKCAEKNK